MDRERLEKRLSYYLLNKREFKRLLSYWGIDKKEIKERWRVYRKEARRYHQNDEFNRDIQ